MRQEIVEKTYELIDEIQETRWFKAFMKAHKTLHDAHDLTPLLASLKETQARYLACKQYGQHHPDLAVAKKAYIEVKELVFQDARVGDYLKAHRRLEAELASISKTIAHTISKNIKTTPILRSLWEASS